MRQWLPHEIDVDLQQEYRAATWAPEGRAGIALDMVVGVDGGVTIGGRSGPIGGDADWTAFTALRDAADVILVGAGTVRTENYGPPVLRAEVAAGREAEGRNPVATMVIVSRSLTLDPGLRAFSDPQRLPIVVAPGAADGARAALLEEQGIEVWRVGGQEVDLVELRDRLAGRGLRQLLCEGGPQLNTTLFRAGLVDEVFVSLAPKITGSKHHLVVPDGMDAVDLDLIGVVHDAGELVLRYRVVRTD